LRDERVGIPQERDALQKPDAQDQQGNGHDGQDANPKFVPESLLFFLFRP
jgi:hypothetical protein